MKDRIIVAKYPPPVTANFAAAVVHIKEARAKPAMRYHVAYFWNIRERYAFKVR